MHKCVFVEGFQNIEIDSVELKKKFEIQQLLGVVATDDFGLRFLIIGSAFTQVLSRSSSLVVEF